MSVGSLRLKVTFSSSSFAAGGYQSMLTAIPPTVRTVSDLLHHLQSRPYLSALKDQCHYWSASIDGFRLPEESLVREVLRDDELITIDGTIPTEEEPSVIYALPPTTAADTTERHIRLDEASTSTPKKRSLREVRKGTPKPKSRVSEESSDSSSEESSDEESSDSDSDETVSEVVKTVKPVAGGEMSSSSSDSSESSESSESESEPTPDAKRRKVDESKVIGNGKVRFVAASSNGEKTTEGTTIWKFTDWHEKTENLQAGQFLKFRCLKADPVTGSSRLGDAEVWKLLAMDEGKAVLVDEKGRNDVIPEKDMFGLLIHDPVSEKKVEESTDGNKQEAQVASPSGHKGPRISSLAYVPPPAADKAAQKRQKKKFGAIRRQVEWWLNKPNWEKDEHLRSLAYPGTHWVPIHELMKFDRLRDLSDDQSEVVHVLRTERCGKQDPRVEVSPDGYYVRHKCWAEVDTSGGPKKAA